MVPYIPLSMHIVGPDLSFRPCRPLAMIVSFGGTHKATLELSQFSIPETVIFGQMPVVCGHQSWSVANA
jgi:hypothetical protein